MKKKIMHIGLIVWAACQCLSFTSYSLNIERFVIANTQGNGTSWGNACGSIQKAVNDVVRAGSGIIHVAEGTYKEVVKIPTQSKNITLLGGYPANGQGERDYEKHRTIIDASSLKDCCLTVDYFCKKISVEGFYIKGAFGSLRSPASGITILNPSTSLRFCFVVSGRDKGIYIKNGREDNYQTDVHEQVLVDKCLVSGCSYGIVAENALIKNTVIMNNQNGGLSVTGGSVYNCLIASNGGTGVSMRNGALLHCCRVYNNTGKQSGGILIKNGGKRNIIYGSVICNNTAKVGSGSIYMYGSLLIESSTIINNYSTVSTGGIEGYVHGGIYFNMAGCILWNNRSLKKPEQFVLEGVQASFFRCAIQGGGLLPETDAEKGIINVSPKNEEPGKFSICFKNVSSIVGSATTMEQHNSIGKQDLHLSANSCCIGNGGYFDNVKIDRSSNLDGVRSDNLMNIGAY